MNLTKALKRRLFKKRRIRKLAGTSALSRELDLEFRTNGTTDFKALRQHFIERKTAFPGPAFDEKSLILQLLERFFPEERTQILSQADQICSGQVTLFQNVTLEFEKDINWHATFASDRSWPLLPSDQIDCRSAERPGDVKLVWELNRHQFLHLLGKAFWYTNDEKYLRAVKHHLADWIEKNPVGVGINWESTLEVAIRLVSWCWQMFYFQKQSSFFDDFFLTFLKSVFEHAEFVFANLTNWGNNHVIGESAGLWFAAQIFPEFKRAVKWQRKARSVLESEIQRQVTLDGVSRENSVCYHRFVLDFYLLVLHSVRRRKTIFPESVTGRVREMLISLDTLCRPDRKFPRLGDDDSSQGLIFSPDPEDAYFLTLGLGSYLFKTRMVNTRIIPNLIWLLGTRFQEIEFFTPRPAKAAAVSRGGYLIFQNKHTPESDYVLLDAGKMGLPPSFSHAHSDRLNFELMLQGIPIFEDSGTFTYNGDAEWRNFFRSTRAHNTLSVSDSDQAVMTSTFQWMHPPQTMPPFFCQNEIAVLMSGAYTFTAAHPAAGIKHRRLLLHLKPEHWLVIDLVMRVKGKQIFWYFQSPPENQLIRIDTADYLIRRSSKKFQLSFRNTESIDTQIHFGDKNLKGGWVSPGYHIRYPRPTLEVRTEAVTTEQALNLTYIRPLDSDSPRVPLELKWLPLTTEGNEVVPTSELFGIEVQTGAMFVTLVINVNLMEISFLEHSENFPVWLELSEPGKELILTGDLNNGNLKFFNER